MKTSKIYTLEESEVRTRWICLPRHPMSGCSNGKELTEVRTQLVNLKLKKHNRLIKIKLWNLIQPNKLINSGLSTYSI